MQDYAGERSEYGYICNIYFFELVDSSSIDWQIRRFVTAMIMKLTSCSRRLAQEIFRNWEHPCPPDLECMREKAVVIGSSRVKSVCGKSRGLDRKRKQHLLGITKEVGKDPGLPEDLRARMLALEDEVNMVMGQYLGDVEVDHILEDVVMTPQHAILMIKRRPQSSSSRGRGKGGASSSGSGQNPIYALA
ncbi:hypothetical protein MTR67_018628, partial [Solanum verrucosum]